MAKSIWTQKEATIRGDENDIIFAWGISELLQEIHCKNILSCSSTYPSKGCGKNWDALKNVYLKETRFGNYTR